MVFEILTLFPDYVDNILNESILGRARQKGLIEVKVRNIRDYSLDKHRRVDDTPCGGGMGMLMACQPIYDCHRAAMAEYGGKRVRTVFLSAQGQPFKQKKAAQLAADYDVLILLCGHYEGVDRRVIELCCDEEISIGDFVLTGGELPACIVVDAVARLIDGVLSDKECHEKESFSAALLEEPQYTRPIEFMGKKVPDVLLSGDHEKIRRWRHKAALELTGQNRPDLL